MIKELMHAPIFLAGKSEVAAKEDLQVAQDLLNTVTKLKRPPKRSLLHTLCDRHGRRFEFSFI